MPIFDQGYQHWSGELSGHGWRWLAIARNGVRAGLKGRMLRMALLLAWVPALILAGFLCIWGLIERKAQIIQFILTVFSPGIVSDPRHYRLDFWTLGYHFFLTSELYISMGIIMLVGPSLVSQDLRFNALPLYFSRPLRRIDYFFGKLCVIAGFLALVIIVPSIAAYILGLLFSLDITIIRDTLPLLLGVILYGLIFAVSAGLLVLALSSLSRNSRYVMLMWLALWFITVAAALVLQVMSVQQRVHQRARVMMQEQGIPNEPMSQLTPAQQRQARQIRFRVRRDESFATDEMSESAHDWRPLVSYTANLARLERALLRTDDSWRDLSLLDPEGSREEFLYGRLGPQYPWYWSAAVLAGLCGISLCILHFQIRSLDRLK